MSTSAQKGPSASLIQTDADAKTRELEESLKKFFTCEVDALVRLSTNSGGQPLGFAHVDLLNELSGANFSNQDLRELRLAYILHSAYYFLLDAITDGHLAVPSDATYLTLMLNVACGVYLSVAGRVGVDLAGVLELLLKFSSENALAVRTEQELFDAPLSFVRHDDFATNIGRSNSFSFFYEYGCLLTGRKADAEVIRWLHRTIHAIQLGDDLSDWRGDYRSKRYTGVIRKCFHSMNRPLTEEELEYCLLMEGFIEAWLIELIQELDILLADIEAHSQRSHLLKTLLRAQRYRCAKGLTDVVRTKLTFKGKS